MKASIVTLVVFLCLAAYIYPACKPVWQFDHLERNAKKLITAAELQAWATNVIAAYPTNSKIWISELGTNFPMQLRGLAPKLGPSVWFYEGDGTNSPRWVRLYWGSGFLGAHGFEIGPTNFVSERPGHAWAPGVYFYEK
jgi:hypothetical protein